MSDNMLKKSSIYNRYLIPRPFAMDLKFRLALSYYWCNLFYSDSGELAEVSSNVPVDIYKKLLEEVKEFYLESTEDYERDYFAEHQQEIDQFNSKFARHEQKEYPLFTYRCSNRMFDYVRDVLTKNSYFCNVIESTYDQVTFTSDVANDMIELILERAKMEVLSSQKQGCIYISDKEDRGYLGFGMHSYWKLQCWITPSEEELKPFENEVIEVISEDQD